MDAPLPRLLTPQEVALGLSLPTDRVIRMARRGDIPCVFLPGGDLLFDPPKLASWPASLHATPEKG
jgi:hypothetical protein